MGVLLAVFLSTKEMGAVMAVRAAPVGDGMVFYSFSRTKGQKRI